MPTAICGSLQPISQPSARVVARLWVPALRPPSRRILGGRCMDQQGAAAGEPQPACPALAREHLEARFEAGQLAAQVDEQQEPYALAMLGDSITAQLADAFFSGQRNATVVRAEGALGGRIGVFGVPGDTVENLMYRLGHGGMPAARAYVIQIGTNDVQTGDTPHAIVEQIKDVVAFVRGHHPTAHIVLLSLFWMDCRLKQAQAVNAALRAFVTAASDPLLHYCGAGEALPPDLFPDGIHPEDEAWRRVFETLTSLVQRLLQ